MVSIGRVLISAWALRCLFNFDRQLLEPQNVGRTTDGLTLFLCRAAKSLLLRMIWYVQADMIMEFEVINTEKQSCVGLIPNVLPKVNDATLRTDSNTGVSTRNIPTPTNDNTAITQKNARWYVLKTTYGREKKACDYLIAQNIKTFYPTITTVKERQGKRKTITESRLTNLFFAYGTESQLTPLVQKNPLMPYLRFYCRFHREAGELRREPITVPQKQMESLMKICAEEDTLLFTETIHKFEKGEMVRIVKGPFCGVEGRIARFKGQQRVGVIIDGLLTVVTAYVPTAYVELIRN